MSGMKSIILGRNTDTWKTKICLGTFLFSSLGECSIHGVMKISIFKYFNSV